VTSESTSEADAFADQEILPGHRTPSAAVRRQSFGAWAQDYQKFRPGYPPELVTAVLAQHPDFGARPLRVVDIGAGTGQLTRTLLELGCEVTAVEPDDRMRAVLIESVGTQIAVAGSAEDLPVADGSVDAVLGAQMWHWVDPNAALPEIARVLRPGGLLAILWNLRDDRVDWIAEIGKQVALADAYQWFKEQENPSFDDSFGSINHTEVDNVHTVDRAGVLGLFRTFSAIGLAADAEEILAEIAGLVDSHPQTAGRDLIDVPYVCKIFVAARV